MPVIVPATPLVYPFTRPAPSFGHIEFKLNGFPFIAIKSIDYSRTRTREKVRGAHPDPLGKTLGENDYKATCEIYLPAFNLFVAQLRASGALSGTGYGDMQFNATVTYNAPGFDVITDTIVGCTLDSTDATNAQGAGALTRKFDLDPIKILFNGIDDVSTPLPQAAIFQSISSIPLAA